MEIPGYTIEKQIGKGGMARVYLATHLGLDRKVAIKVMNRQPDDDSGFSERFMREARIVANLTHQNIVTVYDVGSHDGYNYIAMEYLPGGITLDDKIKDGIDVETGINTIKQIAAALGFAHSRDPVIVHRDVKPENIMYREDGSAVLTDFGIARASTSVTKMTATGTVIGTPHYMSPEQAQGHDIGAFSDIYSLGVVFYEMLTGKVPYDADSTIAVVFKHITEPVPLLEGDLAVFQPVLDRMMAKDKAERYASCEEIITELNEISGVDMGATLVNTATTVNKARPTSAHGSKLVAAETVINAASGQTQSQTQAGGESEQETSGSNRKLIISAVAAALLIAVGVGSYVYTQQVAEQEAIAQQQKAEQQRQAKLGEERRKAEQAAADKKAEAQKAADAKRLAEQRKADEAKAAEAARIAADEKRKSDALAKRRAEEVAKKRAAQQAAAKKARDAKQKKINSLLAQAEQQLLDARLKSAYDSFNEVLKLDSANKRARQGITRVGDRYLTLATSAASTYDFDKASDYVKSVINIDPAHSKLASTQAKIFEYRTQQQTEQAARQQASQPATQPAVAKEPEKKRRSFGGF